jgi:transposase-like protein
MSKSKLNCYHCDSKIIVYYNESYKGNRGKCSKCKADFPLD